MTHFRHRYPPVHIERKRAGQLQKFAPQKLDLTNFLIKLLICLVRKYYFHFTFQKRGLFVRSVVIDLHDEYLASITVKYDSSAPCGFWSDFLL